MGETERTLLLFPTKSEDEPCPDYHRCRHIQTPGNYQSDQSNTENEENILANEPTLFNTCSCANGDVPHVSRHSPASGLNEDLETTSAVPLLDVETHVYTSRWYVLTVFSALALLQGGLVDSWPVIAASAEAAYGWTEKDFSLLQAWIYITFLVSIVPFTWLMDQKGMRVSVLLTSALVLLGSLCRCVSRRPPLVTWMAHLGNILVGFAGPVVFFAGPVLSTIWFPPHQRATATAIMTISGFAGPTWGFLLGPALVEQPVLSPNYTLPDSPSVPKYSNVDEMRWHIFIVRCVETALVATVALFIFLHFPSKPKLPPCKSAAQPRISFIAGARELLRKSNGGFWLLTGAYTLSAGLWDAWGGLLDVYVTPLGVSELEAGWLGGMSSFAGSVLAIGVGRLADVFGHMKLMSLLLLFGCIVSTFWYLLIVNGYIPFNNVQLCSVVILQGLMINAPIPLFYELAMEATYPVDETVSSAMMSLIYNIFPLVYLGLFWVLTGIGLGWTSWFLYICLILAFPMLIFFKEKFHRLSVDLQEREEQ